MVFSWRLPHVPAIHNALTAVYVLAFVSLCLINPEVALSQTDMQSSQSAVSSEQNNQGASFTKREIKETCDRYEGKFIANYGNIFYVQDCKRRPVDDHELILRLTRGKTRIIEVGNEVIAMLPDGEKLLTIDKHKTIRTCRDLQDKYISYASSDVYYIDRCKRHLLPDWETYLAHRNARQAKPAMAGIVIDLSWEEFNDIPLGKAIPSILDKLNGESVQNEVIVVLPIDEACQGLNGAYASYYSKLYRIEKCRKREIKDIEKFFFQRRGKELDIKELSSDQWMSLPDGKIIDNR